MPEHPLTTTPLVLRHLAGGSPSPETLVALNRWRAARSARETARRRTLVAKDREAEAVRAVAARERELSELLGHGGSIESAGFVFRGVFAGDIRAVEWNEVGREPGRLEDGEGVGSLPQGIDGAHAVADVGATVGEDDGGAD